MKVRLCTECVKRGVAGVKLPWDAGYDLRIARECHGCGGRAVRTLSFKIGELFGQAPPAVELVRDFSIAAQNYAMRGAMHPNERPRIVRFFKQKRIELLTLVSKLEVKP